MDLARMKRSLVCFISCLIVLAGCTLTTNDEDEGKSEVNPSSPIAARNQNRCATDEDSNGFMTEAELISAVDCGISDYQWPPNIMPDAQGLVQQQNPTGDTINYQIGYEHSVLSGANQCSWFQYWYTAHTNGNEEAEEDAMNYLSGDMLRLEELIPGFPPDLRAGEGGGVLYHLQSIVQQAQLGDFTGLIQMTNGCIDVPLR